MFVGFDVLLNAIYLDAEFLFATQTKMQFGSARNGWFENSRTPERGVTFLYVLVDVFGFLDPLGFGFTSCFAFLFLSNSEQAARERFSSAKEPYLQWSCPQLQ